MAGDHLAPVGVGNESTWEAWPIGNRPNPDDPEPRR